MEAHGTAAALNGLVQHLAPEAHILVVDDDEGTVNGLDRILKRAGFQHVLCLTDSRRVLPEVQSFEPDVLLLDLNMPHLDGFTVMRQVRDRLAPGEYFPILVISGEMDVEVQQRALAHGATDFLGKPYDAAEVVLRLRNLLDARMLYRRWQRHSVEQMQEIRSLQLALADRLAMLAELRDYQGGAHTKRVGVLAERIALAMGVPADEAELIGRAAQLHDIGKLTIPDAILLKDGALTLEEMDIQKSHTTAGSRVLSGSSSRILQLGEEIALYHHESWDGTGYTPGLAGETIPLAARITAVADTFDALRHDRPYQRAHSLEAAVDQIVDLTGTRFDPAVVEAFLHVVRTHELPLIEDDPEMAGIAAAYRQAYGGEA